MIGFVGDRRDGARPIKQFTGIGIAARITAASTTVTAPEVSDMFENQEFQATDVGTND